MDDDETTAVVVHTDDVVDAELKFTGFGCRERAAVANEERRAVADTPNQSADSRTGHWVIIFGKFETRCARWTKFHQRTVHIGQSGADFLLLTAGPYVDRAAGAQGNGLSRF